MLMISRDKERFGRFSWIIPSRWKSELKSYRKECGIGGCKIDRIADTSKELEIFNAVDLLSLAKKKNSFLKILEDVNQFAIY